MSSICAEQQSCAISGSLVDSDNYNVWEKETVKYIISHDGNIRRMLRKASAILTKKELQKADEDDLVGMVQDYFIKYSDYDIGDRDGKRTASFLGYIYSGVVNCIKRFNSSNRQFGVSLDTPMRDLNHDSSNKQNSGSTLGDMMVDKTPETELDIIENSLESALMGVRHLRNTYGADIYALLYTSMNLQCSLEQRTEIACMLGAQQDVFDRIYKDAARSESELWYVVSALTVYIGEYGVAPALDVIAKHIPCSASVVGIFA